MVIIADGTKLYIQKYENNIIIDIDCFYEASHNDAKIIEDVVLKDKDRSYAY
jgi:hypothetical protein